MKRLSPFLWLYTCADAIKAETSRVFLPAFSKIFLVIALLTFNALLFNKTVAQTYRSATSASATSGSILLTLTKPTGTVTGDVMIASISVRPATATVTPPSGWTLIRRTNQTTGTAPSSLLTYSKVATSAEGSSYLWSFSTTSGIAGGISTFTGVYAPVNVNAQNGASTASALTHAAPTITTTAPNTLIITAHSMGSSATWTPPTGMTESVDVASYTAPSTSGNSLEMNYATQAAAGATGTRTATASADAIEGCTQIFALLSTTSTTISYAGSPFCTNNGTGAVTFTGVTGGTYSSTTGLSINSSTGLITPSASTVGTYTVTYTYGGSTTTTSVTIASATNVAGASTATCVGGSTGTITATGSGGVTPYTYSLNTGAYQSSATFTGLAAGTYTLNIKSASGCISSTSVVVSAYAASNDDQNATGTNTWIGHMYDGTTFTTYIGQFTEAETFNEQFGGDYVCFNVVSGGVTQSIYTETFSVKYRMNSTRKGLYVVDLGSDDGSRLTVDGTLIYNNFSDQSFSTRPTVLMNLTGTSSLLYEFYENGGANQVVFQNLTLVLANTLSNNTTQNICVGNTGLPISGDVYGTLPSGITLSGTGYQWSYSTTPGGARTTIAGATGATFTPSTAAAPFNVAGTYYLYRNAALSSTKNISPNPYVASNESNAATVTVLAAPAATISYAGSPYCSNAGTATVTLTGTTGGTYTSTTGLSIDATTGDIALGSSTAGTYTVTYTMVNAGCTVTATTSVTVTAAPAATISYAGSPYCSSAGTAQVSLTGTAGGVYSSTTGLSINASTGDIILASSTPGTYTVTYTIAAANGCALFSTAASVTVSAPSSASISYAGSPYCSTAATATVTRTGTAGGVYTSTTGLAINAATGDIAISSSTPGTYVVTYTMVNGGCTNTATASVTITVAPAAAISYAGTPYCSGIATATVTRTGTAGGTYSSTTGLTINASTGDVTPGTSTPGTYTVTYTVAAAGGCAAVSATASVTITAAPSAAISYAGSPYCSNAGMATVTRTGTAGGTYSSTAGLSINAATGAVTLASSTAGTYTVTYTVAAAGGCAAISATTTITITTAPSASITYAGTPYCTNAGTAAVTRTGTAGGTYTSTAGLTISSSTGDITLSTSTPGTYTVTYTVAASGGCAAISATSSITITAAPSAAISYAGSPYCISAGTATVTRTGTAGGTYSSTAGLSINASTGAITLASSTAGTYTVTYTIAASGGCAAFSTTAGITITTAPSAAISYAGTPYCSTAGTASVTRTGTAGGTYSPVSGLSINTATGDVNVGTSTPGTYTVTYTVAAAGGCAAVVATASITITAAPSATISYAGSPYCSSAGTATVTRNGTANGTYSSTTGLSINATTGDVNLSASTAGTYTVTYTVVAAGCSVFTTTTSITVTAQPFTNGSYPGTPYCTNGGIIYPTGTASGGGTISSGAGLSISSTTGAVNLGLSTAGTYTVTYTVPASGGCALYTASTPIIITAAPSATISYAGSPYCSGAGTASVTRTGTAGGTYSSTTGLTLNASTGDITPSSSTPGTYTVTYTIAAAAGCAQFTTTTSVAISTAPSATIAYSATPYCSNAGTASVTRSGTAGGTFTSTTGLNINAVTGDINLSASTAGSYVVTYTIAAAAGCSTYTATANIVVLPAPAISQIPATGLTGNYRFEGDARDATGNNAGTLQNSPAQTADRFNIAGKAYSFNGSSQYVSTATPYTNPTNFTLSIWFKTTTTTGGRLIGFGNSQTGISSSYDRHLYMSNSGQIFFGVYPGSTVKSVNSALSYNDGQWHLATASVSGTAGMVLYVDGAQVGTNSSGTGGENITGYWKIGFDNLNGWVNTPASQYFNGSLDDALIFQRTLTAAEVATLYSSPDGAGNNGPVCIGSALNLTATTAAGASYAWTGPNGFASTLQNPSFAYSAAAAGVYTLQVTSGGCTAVAYTNVASSANAGQWTGNTSTDWADAGNWCSGILPASSTNVVIPSGATRMPVIVSSVSCNNLTINTGASVSIAAAGTLNIAGTLANSGTYTDNGTTVFNGAGQQTFSGVTTFNNLTLNNPGGLLLPAAVTVKNNVTLTAGVLNANDFNLSVAGNWTNNVSTAAFTAGSGTVTFNGTAAQQITGSAATTFNNLTVSNTANTVSLNVNAAVAGNLLVAAGTFDLGAFTADRTTAGGSLTLANNTTLKIGGTGSFPVNYTTNALMLASTVLYAGTNQTVANQTYGNLALSSQAGAATKTLPSTALTIIGNLTSTVGAGSAVLFTAGAAVNVGGNISIGASTTFDGGSYAHTIGGNWTNNGTFTGSTSTVSFTGSNTTIGGMGTQNFNNLTVAASGVSFSSGTIALSGNLATSGSGQFNQAAGGTLVMNGAGSTINGSGISLNNLTVNGSVTTETALTLTGNLAVSGSLTTKADVLTMTGTSKTISGAGAINLNILDAAGSITTNSDFSISSALIVDGSFTAAAGTATFTGSSSLGGTANLNNVTVNGTKLQLASGAVLGIAGQLALTSGTLDVSTSGPNTVNFNGAGAQYVNGLTYSNLVLSNGGIKSAAGAITSLYDITIASGTTYSPNIYTHSIYGNWINNGIFTGGTSTVEFLGPSTSYIRGATTFNILTSNTSSASTELVLQSNVTAGTVNMTKGTIVTGSDTLTITNTRTGVGLIQGNILRTHAFTTGVAYAFEGPDNTITFQSVSGVNSVLVSVNEGVISDFPFGGSISRVYDIHVPAGSYNATLRLHYEDDELNGNNESSMALWHYNGTAWTSQGKTANDTSANFVELSGLTNITNRWTASDDANLVQWNGSVSTDWNTAANWTVLQGSASRPPAPGDIVDLGTAAFLNQPAITTAVTVKNIVFGSVQAVTLTLGSGGSLTTSGDISGRWTGNITHTIAVNNQPLTVNGNIVLSDSTTGHAINLNIGSGTVTTLASLVQSGGASIAFSGAGTLNVYKDFSYSSGSFTPGAGTVIYNGIENQHVAHVNYNNVTINKSAGLAAIQDSITIAGNLLLQSGELDNYSSTVVKGDVTISTVGVFNNYSFLHVQGNWNNQGMYVPNSSSIVFEGANAQSISTSTFNNLQINKPAGSVATLTGDVTLNGNLIGTSGTLDIRSFFFNRLVIGGTATIGDSATLIIAADNAPNKFASYLLAQNSTVIFNGTGTQHLLLPGVVYGNITFRNAGPKILYTSITVMNKFLIESNSSLDAGANTITLNGNWQNDGTFIPSSSTVLLNGALKTISGVTTFNKATVTGSYTFLSNITFSGLLNITSAGSLSAGPTILTTMQSDLINSGILYTLGTTTFTGNVLQTLSLINAVQTVAITVNFNGSVSPVLNSTSAPQFGYLNINNTGGVNPSVGWNIAYALNIGSGASFNGGTSTHNILGSLTNNGTITSSGTLNFIPSAAATLNLGSDFSSTGTVVFGGSGAITLAGTAGSLRNVSVTNSNPAGITPSSNWNMTNNFTVGAGAVFNAGAYSHAAGGSIVNNGTINAGTSLFTLNGTGIQDVRSASAFNKLTINKTAGYVSLSSDLTVGDTLSFVAGNIRTGSNVLVLPLSATVTGAAQNTGWVSGRMQRAIAASSATKTFDVGDATNYTPLTLAFSGVTTAGNLTAYTTAGDHPVLGNSGINPNKSVNRYWSLANSGIAFAGYSATFNFIAADVDAGANTAAFGVQIYNGSSWISSVTALPAAASIQATGVTTFGDFAIGEICNAGTTISYAATPYCSNAGAALVTRTGTGGGIYFSSAGLSLDSTSGTISLGASIPGSYSVTYHVNASGGCQAYSSTAAVAITQAPAATIVYSASTYCLNEGTALVTRTGTPGGSYTSTTGLSINPASGAINLASSTVGTYTVTYTVPAAAGCSQLQTTTTVTVQNAGVWTGALSTDFNVAGNWQCGGVPTGTTNIVVPTGLSRYPVISAAQAVNNITIQAGASLTVNGILSIAGNMVNNGTLTASGATIELNGTAAQQIPAGAFAGSVINNLIINNAAGVTLASTLKLTGVLTVSAGQLNTGGYLVLTSNALATAFVAPITSTAATPINGDVTVERYIPGRRKYRLITSSVTTSTAATLAAGQENLSIWGNWQTAGNRIPGNGNFITGGTAADGFDQQTTNISMFTYNSTTKSYVGYTSANGKNTRYTPLKAGIAFYMWVYGDRTDSVYTSNPHTTVLTAKGALTTGDQAYSTTSAIPLDPVTGNFTLLGNPFASPIDWTALSGTNISNSYWGWDPNLNNTGGYVTVSNLGGVVVVSPFSGSTGLNQYIQPGQGFFVKTTGASPTLLIREQDKTSTNNVNAFRVNNANNLFPLLAVNLFYNTSAAPVLADGAVAAFSDGFTNDVAAEDAAKMSSQAESLALQEGAQLLSIDGRALPRSADTLQLNLAQLSKPQYTLQVFMRDLENTALQPYLEDRFLGTTTALSVLDTNRIVFQVTADTASRGSNRFRIVFRSTAVVLPVSFISISAVKKDAHVQVDWTAGKQDGVKAYFVEHSTNGHDFTTAGEVAAKENSNARQHYTWLHASPAAGANFYRVRSAGSPIVSRVVQVNFDVPKPSVAIFPNPLINQEVNIQFNNMAEGWYTLSLYDRYGKKVTSMPVHHTGVNESKKVQLLTFLASGLYYLQLEGNSFSMGQKVFVE